MAFGGPLPLNTKLKTGNRPGLVRVLEGGRTSAAAGTAAPQQGPVFHAVSPALSKHDRFFKRGTLMFIEGEPGDNMFIIKTGKIKVLKQEGAKSIELAVLGPGSVLGEMSLLIDAPRSATAQVLEDTTALNIDKTILEDTFTKLPPWLVLLIKMVVGRLRDTLQKNTQNLVRDNIGGVVNLLLLLLKDALPDDHGRILFPMAEFKEEVLCTIGLSGADTDKIVTELILKELMVVSRDEHKNEMVEVRKYDILQIYFEYCLAHHNGKELPGERLKSGAVSLATVLVQYGTEKGNPEPDGTIPVSRSVLEIALEKAGFDRHLDLDAVDDLVAQNLLASADRKEPKESSAIKMTAFRFSLPKLKKALLLNEWKETFADAS